MQLLRFHLVEDESCEKEIKQGLEKKLDRMHLLTVRAGESQKGECLYQYIRRAVLQAAQLHGYMLY